MRFLLAVNDDYIDPGFDFVRETFSQNRRPQLDDCYPHEYFDTPPYDGLLVSRAIVGTPKTRGHFTVAQRQRFLRDGAATFLRYDPMRFGGILMGDCGAFSYRQLPEPPYTVPELVDYYVGCGFTHAVAPDHVILGFDPGRDLIARQAECVPGEWKRRFRTTLRLARRAV